VFTLAGFAGVMLAPTFAPWLWMVVLGLGQGSTISLALLIITLRAPDPESVTALSAVAQTVAYVFAAAGPLLIGAIHEATGGWTVPLGFAVGLSGVQLAFAYLAGRPSREGTPRVPVATSSS